MRIMPLLLAVSMVFGTVPAAFGDDSDRDKHDKFVAKLSGYNEVHFAAGPPATLRGAVSTAASGKFEAWLDRRHDVIHYKLSYEDLEGAVTQAHIHFGQQHTVGGIVVWLCQTAGTPAPMAVDALTPLCPPEGKVTGTIVADQVLAQTPQGIEAGAFDELVGALRADAAYANVHSTLFGPGEIRGQIESDDDRDHRR